MFLIDNLGKKCRLIKRGDAVKGFIKGLDAAKTTSVLNDLFWSFVRSVALLLLLLLFSTEAKCECHL